LEKILEGAREIVVIDKSVSLGMGGPLANNVGVALRNLPRRPRLHAVVAGLGGRPITRQSLHRLFRQAATEPWEGTHFLDMNDRVVGREIHRAGKLRRAGPTAEAILRQLAESAPDRAAE
jgi:pyruvate ferredoxin oxidoreductase alpha subunit